MTTMTHQEFPDLFEGPEKTLTLCFKRRRIAAGSLRLVPKETWAEVLKHAKCEILSEVESGPVVPALSQKKAKPVDSKTLTGYLLSESSLFVSDSTCTLKTCGRTTPLAALEAILDVAVPNWQKKDPEHYLRYATFLRLGYMRPEEQLEPHTSWYQEVAHLDKYFRGEEVVLGSEAASTQHIYVANYLPKDEIVDVFSTQVALTHLDTAMSMKRYSTGMGSTPDDMAPLRSVWDSLHGREKWNIASSPKLDERFFEPLGYSANGVFGKHFTTIHITPQPGCSYLSVETSMPMTREARQRFVLGSMSLCSADCMVVTEFTLCPTLFSGGPAPKVQGYEVCRSSQTVGDSFACAFHLYRRQAAVPAHLSSKSPSWSRQASVSSDSDESNARMAPTYPAIHAEDRAVALVKAAAHFLASPGEIPDDAPVALLDVSILRQQAATWFRLLPRVAPFYAVKCNPHPVVVETLWNIWQEQGQGGFDCASAAEIELVATLGIGPAEHIIFANPCKQASAIAFARTAGVRRTVFDSNAELVKLAELYPAAELLLRVQTDDAAAQCPLSNKFGAAPADCPALLLRAKVLGLKVVGVSFHVGSGCSQRGAFRGALRRARAVWDQAERLDFEMTLLDIGGGFPGWDQVGQATFADHAEDICEMLEELFPSPAVRVVAEPGRFFAASAQAMLSTVLSVVEASAGDRYYLNDGLYGSFNCLLYDHASVPRPAILRGGVPFDYEEDLAGGPARACTIFGPTCDGFDMISDTMVLPKLQVGDRLLFPAMGAYTTAASTSFNGFDPPACVVYRSVLLISKADPKDITCIAAKGVPLHGGLPR